MESPILQCSVYSTKNHRKKMEDSHVLFHNLNTIFDIPSSKQYSYYAVFDGHSGVDAAKFAEFHLHKNIVESPYFIQGDITKALIESFKMTDAEFLEKCEKDGIKSGCAVVCCILEAREKLYLAWCGDCIGFVVKNGLPINKMAPHKPQRSDEKERIENSGGCIVYADTWRVNGSLTLSRALGDPDFKDYIISDPEVDVINLDGKEDFLILACDGLWDHVEPELASSLVYEHLALNINKNSNEIVENTAKKLSHRAIEEGACDNITTIVIFLRSVHDIVSSMPQKFKDMIEPDQLDSVNMNGQVCDYNENSNLNANLNDLIKGEECFDEFEYRMNDLHEDSIAGGFKLNPCAKEFTPLNPFCSCNSQTVNTESVNMQHPSKMVFSEHPEGNRISEVEAEQNLDSDALPSCLDSSLYWSPSQEPKEEDVSIYFPTKSDTSNIESTLLSESRKDADPRDLQDIKTNQECITNTCVSSENFITNNDDTASISPASTSPNPPDGHMMNPFSIKDSESYRKLETLDENFTTSYNDMEKPKEPHHEIFQDTINEKFERITENNVDLDTGLTSQPMSLPPNPSMVYNINCVPNEDMNECFENGNGEQATLDPSIKEGIVESKVQPIHDFPVVERISPSSLSPLSDKSNLSAAVFSNCGATLESFDKTEYGLNKKNKSTLYVQQTEDTLISDAIEREEKLDCAINKNETNILNNVIECNDPDSNQLENYTNTVESSGIPPLNAFVKEELSNNVERKNGIDDELILQSSYVSDEIKDINLENETTVSDKAIFQINDSHEEHEEIGESIQNGQSEQMNELSEDFDGSMVIHANEAYKSDLEKVDHAFDKSIEENEIQNKIITECDNSLKPESVIEVADNKAEKPEEKKVIDDSKFKNYKKDKSMTVGVAKSKTKVLGANKVTNIGATKPISQRTTTTINQIKKGSGDATNRTTAPSSLKSGSNIALKAQNMDCVKSTSTKTNVAVTRAKVPTISKTTAPPLKKPIKSTASESVKSTISNKKSSVSALSSSSSSTATAAAVSTTTTTTAASRVTKVSNLTSASTKVSIKNKSASVQKPKDPVNGALKKPVASNTAKQEIKSDLSKSGEKKIASSTGKTTSIVTSRTGVTRTTNTTSTRLSLPNSAKPLSKDSKSVTQNGTQRVPSRKSYPKVANNSMSFAKTNGIGTRISVNKLGIKSVKSEEKQEKSEIKSELRSDIKSEIESENKFDMASQVLDMKTEANGITREKKSPNSSNSLKDELEAALAGPQA